ncbi:MAG: LysR family transcriptional regulator [Streptosporangiales bacterium]|nr:LysR family transcriptional regulator [Streptosporangiales bacterium]
MRLVHLETLRAVLETGSLCGAAKQLGYTTSAVSQQIAALERTLGVPLFERGPRNLWPTAAAVQMGRHASAVLSRLAEAADDMRGYAGGHNGRQRVAAFTTVSSRVAPRALARTVTRFPDAELTLHDDDSADVALAVCEGTADLGLVFEYDLVPQTWPEELRTYPVLDEELVVLCHPEQYPANGAHIDVAELADAIWVTNREGSTGHENLVRLCAQFGFDPVVRYTSHDFDVVRGIVREGLGIALVPALALGTDPAIAMRRLRPDGPRRRVLAVHRATDLNPLVPAALETIHEAAREFTRWTTEALTVRIDSPLASAPAVVIGR